jgi:3-deoxy-D-manno-octulosonic-acid transferase
MLESADYLEPLLYFNECITIQNSVSLTQTCFYLKAASLGDTTIVLRLINVLKETPSFFTLYTYFLLQKTSPSARLCR